MDLPLTKKYILIKEASEASGYSIDYLTRLCRGSKIEATQVGRTWLVNKYSLQEFVREQEEKKKGFAKELSAQREREYNKRAEVGNSQIGLLAILLNKVNPFSPNISSRPTLQKGLAFAVAMLVIATGAYGKDLPKSMGAPLRLHTPWKYGFKSIKAIVKISFVKERPIGMWEAIQASEYGFWANVNPEVSHPRWSQAMEEVLGTGERVPTQLFNGYGEFVAGLYTGLEKESLYM